MTKRNNMVTRLRLFYITVFCLLFLQGANVLIGLGVPMPPNGIFYPATIFIIWSIFLCGLNRILKYKIEVTIIAYLIFVMIFNRLTGRDMGIWSISSILLPPVFSIIINELSGRINYRYLNKMVLTFFVINSVMAIFERVIHRCIFPDLGWDLEASFVAEGFRSYALCGHPLSNSSITLMFMNFILISPLKRNKKLRYWSLGLMALMCFNSRFTLVIAVLMFAAFLVKEIVFVRTKLRNKIMYIMFVVMSIPVVMYLFSIGWGDRLIDMGLYDDSSAAVRVANWMIFDGKSLSDFYFGMPQHQVESLKWRQGIENMIIENCWIIYILRYGIFFLVGLFIVYYPFFKNMTKGYSWYAKLFILLPWFAVISSSNSLASGGLGTLLLVLLFYIYRPIPKDEINIKRSCQKTKADIEIDNN